MTASTTNASSPPWYVPLFSPVAMLLLKLGVPLGPNGLLTVRGRTSGLPRTTPIAIVEVSGRRWIWAPWGEVHWVRNLRASGRATIAKRGDRYDVNATELDADQRLVFFRDVMAPYARRVPLGITFARIVDRVDLDDPADAASGRPVFELERAA